MALISLTPEQYGAIDATGGARRQLVAACRAGEGGAILLSLDDAEALQVLAGMDRADLARAVTLVRWTTLPGGRLYCTPKPRTPTPDTGGPL